jgi:hypothetical protein
MEKKLTSQIHLPFLGLALHKHDQVRKAAQSLLAAEQPGLLDSLNCGKLGRLLRYLRTGVPALLILCCSEYAFR